MTTRIKVNVTFQPGVGYVSEASPRVSRSISALSLEGLRKWIMIVALQRRRVGEEVALTLLLDAASVSGTGGRVWWGRASRTHTLIPPLP